MINQYMGVAPSNFQVVYGTREEGSFSWWDPSVSYLQELGKSSANAQGLRRPVTSGIVALFDDRVSIGVHDTVVS